MSYFRICPSLMTIIMSSSPFPPFLMSQLFSFLQQLVFYFALFHLDSALLSIEPLSLSRLSLSLSLSTVFLLNFFAFLCFLTCTDLYSYLLPTTLRFKFFY